MATLTLRPSDTPVLADNIDLDDLSLTAGQVHVVELTNAPAEVSNIRRVRCAVRSFMSSGTRLADIGLDLGGVRLLTSISVADGNTGFMRYDGAWHSTRPGGGAWALADLQALRGLFSGPMDTSEFSHRVTELYVDIEYDPAYVPAVML